MHSKANKVAFYFICSDIYLRRYGDITPKTKIGKIVTLIYGLSGISLLGVAIGTIGNKLMERQDQLMDIATEDMHYFMNKIDRLILHYPKHAINDSGDGSGASTVGSITAIRQAQPPLVAQIVQSIFQPSELATVALLLLGGLYMGKLENWSTVDSIYFSVITSCTLGYGDFYPTTRKGKLYAILYIPVAVAITGELLGVVANTVMEYRKKIYYNKILNKELNLERLLQMDTNRNGKVSMQEYIEYLLVEEMDIISSDQLSKMKESFHKLDVDGGGYLNKRDMKKMMTLKEAKEKEMSDLDKPNTQTDTT